MATHDKNGKPWAKLSELKEGDKLIADGDFTCLRSAGSVKIKKDHAGFYFECSEGQHYLDGQLDDDGEHLIGLYKP